MCKTHRCGSQVSPLHPDRQPELRSLFVPTLLVPSFGSGVRCSICLTLTSRIAVLVYCKCYRMSFHYTAQDIENTKRVGLWQLWQNPRYLPRTAFQHCTSRRCSLTQREATLPSPRKTSLYVPAVYTYYKKTN